MYMYKYLYMRITIKLLTCMNHARFLSKKVPSFCSSLIFQQAQSVNLWFSPRNLRLAGKGSG